MLQEADNDLGPDIQFEIKIRNSLIKNTV